MNKFQKIACKIAKDDLKKDLYKNQTLKKRARFCYSVINREKTKWPYEKCVDFKNWSKTQSW